MKFQKIVSATDVDDIECPQYGKLYFVFRWILDLQITISYPVPSCKQESLVNAKVSALSRCCLPNMPTSAKFRKNLNVQLFKVIQGR